MSWQLILIISLSFSSLSVILQKTIHQQRDSDPVTFAVIFQLLGGLIIGIFGIISGEFKIYDLQAAIPNLIVMSLLYGFGNIFFFLSYKYTETSIVTIISNSSAVFTMMSAAVVFGLILKTQVITLSLVQILAIGLIFFSIVIGSWRRDKFSFSKAERYALLGSICFGIEITNDKILLNYFSTYAFTTCAFILPAVLMIIFFRKRIKNLPYFLAKKVVFRFAAAIILYVAQAVLYFIALQTATNTVLFGGIALSGGVITVLMSVLLLKEKDNLLQKFLGIAIGVFGLLLLG